MERLCKAGKKSMLWKWKRLGYVQGCFPSSEAGYLILCRVQWNLETIKLCYREIYCPVSKSLVSAIGWWLKTHSEKHRRMAKRQTLNFSQVAFCDSWPKSYPAPQEGAETCLLKRRPETTGAASSWGMGQHTCWEVKKSPWQLQEWFDCQKCIKRLCYKISS